MVMINFRQMKKALIVLIILLCPVFFGLSNVCFAKLGVGVGTGNIVVDEDLKPGMVYDLPNLTVFNTGDEPSDYTADVAYRENEEAMRPPKEWFEFKPKDFYLEPDGSQSVKVTLKLPFKAEPGEYFAFLQGKPVVKEEGGATIGIAAAAKLRFTVAPANVLSAVYYRGLHFWQDYYPWTVIGFGVIAGITVAGTLKKLLGIEVNVKMGQKKKEKPKDEKKKNKDE